MYYAYILQISSLQCCLSSEVVKVFSLYTHFLINEFICKYIKYFQIE